MIAQAARPAALLATLALALGGCGDGEESGQGPPSQAAPASVLEQADANCRQVRREAVQLADRAFSGDVNLSRAATERLIKPSVPLLEGFASRQQRLARGTGDPELELYARLFDPLIVLVQERLRSGEESDSPLNEASRGFELLTGSVADEQRQVAREAGLRDCAIDFEQALTSALRP
ncbi:MAG TPA: hypothetical protein VFY48_04045 [Solirubrobacterales bacterium]|nr:hypothetical protein [Solirubrobacterales bacterium]